MFFYIDGYRTSHIYTVYFKNGGEEDFFSKIRIEKALQKIFLIQEKALDNSRALMFVNIVGVLISSVKDFPWEVAPVVIVP